jgi:hypothetical protein
LVPFRRGRKPAVTFVPIAALAAFAAAFSAGCESNDPLDADNARELTALLEDGELPTQLGALTTDPGPAPNTPPGMTPPTAPPKPMTPPTPTPPMSTPPVPPKTPDAAVADAGTGGSTGSDGGGPVDAVVDVRDATAPPDGKFDGPIDPCFPSDGGFPGPGCRPSPLARWSLDDCNNARTELRDDMNGFTAYRTVGATCVEGIENLGVSLPHESDLVYAPDQPAYTFRGGVTVAAWLRPTKLTSARTIFRKREGLTSSLALITNGRNVQFIINRERALPAAISAPLQVNRWTHVAATYDGTWLRLYLDGVEYAAEKARGVISDGEGPLLFGNDILQRRFEGTIDSIWFETFAADPATIASLMCIRKPPLLSVAPSRSEPTPPGGTATFTATLTNASTDVCPADGFFLQGFAFANGFNVQPGSTQLFLGGGQSADVPFFVTSSDDAEPGDTEVQFSAFNFTGGRFVQTQASATFVTSEPTGCNIRAGRELLIRNPGVVDDSVRTAPGTSSDPRHGVWTFKHLMEAAAPTPADAPRMVEQIIRSFTTQQTINGFRVDPRPGMQFTILDPWPRTPAGELDLDQAPVRLLAIVNRIDLRQLDEGHAGEGRFVFGLQFNGFPLEATMILEYQLPATSEADVLNWAAAWHGLNALPFPSEAYNAALSAVTARFTERGAAPGRTNGSALLRVRTNEIAFSDNGVWQLREFTFDEQGFLRPATIKLTPDRPAFDRTTALAGFINANEEAILNEVHDVPATLDGQPFLAGAVFNDLSSWSAPGIRNPEARHKFALNTCNGCHSSEETNTGFLMVGNRFPGQESFLSPFLTGTTVFDRETGPRSLNDLRRRNLDMRLLVCPDEPLPPPPPGFGGFPGGSGGSPTGAGGSGGFSGSGGVGGFATGGSPGTGGRVSGTAGRGGSSMGPVGGGTTPSVRSAGVAPSVTEPGPTPAIRPTIRSGIRRTH